MNPNDIARFWSYVEISDKLSCWNWRGTTTHGYGEISIKLRKYKAHRLAWLLTNGLIPRGVIVRHNCDNPRCCNPQHLCLGTSADNSKDMVKRGRSMKGIKHPLAILSDNDVILIRADSRSQRAIAQAFGISQATVSRIKTRSLWSHVTND